jgi:hypothetical protein
MTQLGLVVNLESMWDDFTVSVNSFVGALEKDEAAKASTLAALEKTEWVIRPLTIPRDSSPSPATATDFITLAPSVSATAIVVPPEKHS